MLSFLTALQVLVAERIEERDERGATMVEYGLMLALIAVVCIVAVALIGTRASTMFSQVATSI